ncbi:MAG: xanthine dehydrogenase family protein molybdopterin-binding subunit [Treponema sp.]|nr:xanthine dehydrogenase family protein molybdopterin-binding subunit [Treponema sp.]
MPEKKVTKARALKVSFENEFYSDLSANGMLYVKVIRSPIKKGIITSVTHPALPDGYFIFTARNIPGMNFMDTPLGKIPILSEGNVSYLGEPIALLAGPDEKLVLKFFNEIQIGFDRNSIDYYFSVNEAKTKGRRKKKSDTEENSKEEIEELFSPVITTRDVLYGKESNNFDKLFEEKDGIKIVKTESTYALTQLHCSETSGSLCTYEDSKLTVFTPTQWFYSLRTILSESLAIDADDIIIKKTKSFNNGTNGIYFNSVITAQTALVSVLTGKSAKLVYTRLEQEKFMESMQPIKITHRSAVTKDAKIKAMDVNIEVDAGFINPFCQEIIDRLVIASTGCYQTENLRIHATAERSYNPPSSIDLRQIDNAAFFALENHMNQISTELGIFPTDLRIANFTGLSKRKQKTAKEKSDEDFPFIFEFEKPVETINALAENSDFNRKYFFYSEESRTRKNLLEENTKITTSAPLKGIGFACAYEGSCYYGSQVYSHEQILEVTLEKDLSLTIHCPGASESIELIWKKTASSIMDIPQGSINLSSAFENEDEPLSPESVYSNISVMTELLKKCCTYLKKKKTGTKLPVTVRKSISPKEKEVWNKETFSGRPFHSTAFAACSVEAELDRTIYRANIKSISIVISGGKILSLSSAENAITLAVLKVLRSFIQDDETLCPDIHISFIQSDKNPCQIGELIFQVLPAAITQALSQCINCRISSVPLKTSGIFDVLKQKLALKKQEEKHEDITDSERQKHNA